MSKSEWQRDYCDGPKDAARFAGEAERREWLAKASEEEFIEAVSTWILLAARATTYSRFDEFCGQAYEVNPDLYARASKRAERMR